jgi:hypothetical protein
MTDETQTVEVLVVARDDPAKSSKIKRAVYNGNGWRFSDQRPTAVKHKTQGGLGPDDLMVNPKTNKVVSKKMHAAGTARMASLRERGLAAKPFAKKATPPPETAALSPEFVESTDDSTESASSVEEVAPPPPPAKKKRAKKATAGAPTAGKARARKA